MRTAGDGEVQGVVVEEPFGFASRVAQVAVLAIIIVARDSDVVFISIGLIMGVAAKTAEILEIVRVYMTCGAVIPLAGVFAGEDGEERVMVSQQGRSEGGHLVALIAIGREPGADVIGAGDFEILLLVAADTSSRLKRKITFRQPFVAALAVSQGVTAHQGEIRFGVDILDIENRETVSGVAFSAIGPQFGLVDVFMAGDALPVDY